MIGQELKDIIDELASHNTEKYNALKAVEELNELSAAILQNINKTSNNEEIKHNIIEEIGDVFYRLKIYIQSENIEIDLIHSRILNKLTKCKQHLDEKKYTNI